MSRGLNINNSNARLMSSADMGGRSILHMGGSLTNYIHTGNAGRMDSFSRAKNNYPQRKKFNFEKHILQPLAVLFTVGTAVVLSFKNKGKIHSKLTAMVKDFKLPKINISESVENIKKSASKKAEKTSSEKSKINLSQKFSNFIKKAPKDETAKKTVKPKSKKAYDVKGIFDNLKNKFKRKKPDIIDTTLVETNILPEKSPKTPMLPEATSVKNEVVSETVPKIKQDIIEAPMLPEANVGTDSVSKAVAEVKTETTSVSKPKDIAETTSEVAIKTLPAEKSTVVSEVTSEVKPEVASIAEPRAMSESISEVMVETSETPKSHEIKPEISSSVETVPDVPSGYNQSTLREFDYDKYKSGLTHHKLETVKPFSEQEMEELKLLCGFDVPEVSENIEKSHYFYSSKDAQKVYKDYLKKVKNGENSFRTNKIDTITNPETGVVYKIYYPEDPNFELVKPIEKPFVFDKSALSHNDLAPVKPLDKEFLDDALKLTEGASEMTEKEAQEYLATASPRFSFADYAKNKKSSPYMQRIRHEMRQEKMEGLQEKIKVPKRPKQK